ncbi:MAG: UDP-N-acetylmuramate dehydrogenase [Alphaproteobacteria bacterium]|nr:UDP-N-acetylmuramate dehydrogenase [Alphaproteobacteria bacterium]
MQQTEAENRSWKSSLSELGGRLSFDAPLAGVTWFQVGGKAEVLYRPPNLQALQTALRLTPARVAVTVIGVASNLLIRDGGIDGLVIRLGREFAAIEGDREQNRLRLGASVLDLNAATYASNSSLSGLEFLSGIPGTIGGAVKMNAGAYGRDMAAVLHSVAGVGRGGESQVLAADSLHLTYRHCDLPEGFIVTEALVKVEAGSASESLARIAEIKAAREATQPIRSRTGGSSFKNPPPDSRTQGLKAGELIDAAGCRGLVKGGAQVSPLHCNFLINDGTATASEIEDLGEEVRQRVAAKFGVMLEWEIAIIGKRQA